MLTWTSLIGQLVHLVEGKKVGCVVILASYEFYCNRVLFKKIILIFKMGVLFIVIGDEQEVFDNVAKLVERQTRNLRNSMTAPLKFGSGQRSFLFLFSRINGKSSLPKKCLKKHKLTKEKKYWFAFLKLKNAYFSHKTNRRHSFFIRPTPLVLSLFCD